MHIVCLITNLASGGAQRQLLELSSRLAQRGHRVEVACHHPDTFFLPQFQARGIPYSLVGGSGKLLRVPRFYRWLRERNPDVVLAFLTSPSMVAELCSLPWRRFGVVVSERNTDLDTPPLRTRLQLILHALADVVVANSHTNRLMVESRAPWLKGKVFTVYNMVDLDTFKPASTPPPPADKLSLLGVGRVVKQKNIPNLLIALRSVLDTHPGLDLHLDWYGEMTRGPAGHRQDSYGEFARIEELMRQHDLGEVVTFHPPRKDLLEVYQSCSALVLPSLYEGLPNVVGEAAACGRPVLVTDVCDNASLVEDGQSGILLASPSAKDIAEGLSRFVELTPQERHAMGPRSRSLAQRVLSSEPFVDHYEAILEAAMNHRRPLIGHSVETVPAAAYRTVEKSR